MNRFSTAVLIVCLLSLPGFAAQHPINEMPMYGGVEKTPSMKKADEAFIRSVRKQGYSREKGARHMAGRGWEFFSKGDMSSAVKRFNQAWLLDPDYYAPYWGFALVYLVRDNDVQRAGNMFEEAEARNPDQGNFYVEYGRFTEETGSGSVDRAIALFEKGLEMSPDIRDGYIGLIRAYGGLGDIESAYRWYKQGKNRGVFSAGEVERFDAEFREAGKQ